MPGRDALGLAAAFDWSAVVVALITLLGVVFNSCVGLVLWWHLRTPSGTRIGKQVEDVNHKTIINTHRLEELAKRARAADDEAVT